ncbi:hypothetical protein, partial [Actinoplanes sp. ATCC 53533]|uniref:hypothetical protein n=1 Tax=Actinoplanes sp. ATCC 53533 TaxID=1288362 RepID=UPI001315163D
LRELDDVLNGVRHPFMLWRDKIGTDRPGIVPPDPDRLLPEPASVLREAGLTPHQLAVHGQDRRYFDIVGEPQGGFHGADVADDGMGVRLVALAELGERQLPGAGREVFDL